MHVDALSRIVYFIESMPLEKEIQFRQLEDSKLKVLAEKLESEEDENYEFINGLVFKKSTHKSRFVIPAVMINKILPLYHDDMA